MLKKLLSQQPDWYCKWGGTFFFTLGHVIGGFNLFPHNFISYFIGSFLWLGYGFIHRDKAFYVSYVIAGTANAIAIINFLN